jgi:hypothetical protein
MRGSYQQVYAEWKRDPVNFWQRAGGGYRLVQEPEQVFSAGIRAHMGAGSSVAKPIHATTVWIGTFSRGRGGETADYLRQPGQRRQAVLHL